MHKKESEMHKIFWNTEIEKEHLVSVLEQTRPSLN